MTNLQRRLKKLEEALSAFPSDGRPRRTLRVVVGYDSGPAKLETSKCHRRLDRNGLLYEVLELDGGCEDLEDEDVDRFIEGFPIEAAEVFGKPWNTP